MPAGALPPLIAVLKADIAHFSAAMATVKAETAAATSHSEAAFRGMAALGKVALMGLGGAAITAGGFALHMAGNFQEAMTLLVTGAGESQANLRMVSQGVLEMAGKVGVSAEELAKGLYMIESAGYHGSDGLKVLQAAAEGARVGNANMATVADAVTSALNAYHLSGQDAVTVTNDLIATVASGKMHMEDLAGALGTVLPAASTAGVSLKEVSAAIATMTMQGTPAADAATYLRQTILQLENPSAKAQKALADVGLSSRQLADDLGKKGLAATLQEATDAISKKFAPGSSEYVAHLANMVGGTKSMQAALELTGQNMAVFKANSESIGKAVQEGGNEVRGWSEVQKDFNFRIGQAKESLGALAIKIGMDLIPVAEKALDITSRFADYLSKHHDAAIAVAAAIAGPLAIAIAAYTVAMIQAAVATVAATWPILLVVAAVAALVAIAILIYQHWGQIAAFFGGALSAAIHGVGGAFSALGTKVHEIVSGVVDWLRSHWQQILGILGGPLMAAVMLVAGHWSQIRALFMAAVVVIKSIVEGFAHTVVGFFQWLFDHNYYFHNLVLAIRAAWQLIQQHAHEIWSAITGWIKDRWNWLHSTAQNTWNAITDAIHRAVTGAQNRISDVWNAVTGWLRSIWDSISGTARDIWNNVVSAISNALGGVWSAVTDPIGRAVNWIKNLAGEAWNWGWNMVEQFLNGLKAKAGDVAGAVQNIAGTIGSYLGFHSPPAEGPAKDSDTWAPNFIAMLVAGLEGGQGRVAAAAAGVASSLAVRGTAQPGGTAVVGGGSAQLTASSPAIATDGIEARLDTIADLLCQILQTGNVANPLALIQQAVSRATQQAARGVRGALPV